MIKKKRMLYVTSLLLILIALPLTAYAADTIVPVTDIINVPTTAYTDTPLSLTETVIPTTATFQTINWNIKDAGITGAILNGNILNANNEGSVTVTATIKNSVLDGKILELASGNLHVMAITTTGSLWGWGVNTFGQLGDGSYGNFRLLPCRIGTDSDWVAVAPGLYHTLALKKDGSLWAWGRNNNGQLGDGTLIDRLTPVQIGTDTNWATIVTGNIHSIALKKDGSLWLWGSNEFGQLGDNTSIDRLSPQRLGADNDWEIAAGGYNHTLALKKNGSLWAWGQNSFGQLGNGTITESKTPVNIAGSWSLISAGGYHNLALKADGSLWAWGLNSNGQLGDNTTGNRYAPVRVGVENNWSLLEAGGRHSLALKNDGSLWSWGQNTYSQLGNGSTADNSNPSCIDSSFDWNILAAGDCHSLALKKDASLFAWGNNNYGQFGNGTTTGSTTPVDVTPNLLNDFAKDFNITIIKKDTNISVDKGISGKGYNQLSKTGYINTNGKNNSTEIFTNIRIVPHLDDNKQWYIEATGITKPVTFTLYVQLSGNSYQAYKITITGDVYWHIPMPDGPLGVLIM
ncbi:MAG: Ig-like domain-containing protein [Firmicutes bacterium]|nr:Ig-like domain-containing protein [Bacillota bacterium]